MEQYIYRILAIEINNGEKFYVPQCKERFLSFFYVWKTINQFEFISTFSLGYEFSFKYKTEKEAEAVIGEYKKYIIDTEIKSITFKKINYGQH